ncbi:copper chaperone PCu(A)C [Pseudomonas sp. CDFA 602]|uniref:copper chaperone PCu(A)C n=1 Tax=Pseudomonas californiensis TaxID=2829823 RepID=UPI001E5B07AF|nr:copper chaperone PCu(A)C [Pseudomonas californiensis]MCD5993417.1 copper chaperone PCu(A)C [Pseudomonas californiensis]MCD5999012.1 copper chaperone PCu(A)C [Pseudomonas californiensis]
MNAFTRNAAKSVMLAVSLLALSAQVQAQIQVDDAWVRATVPGQPATGAFMRVTSTTDSTLVDVASPVAKTVQIHQSSMKNDVMSMQQVTSVELPAGKPVVFDSNGYHVMFIGLVAQVKEGDQVPLTLTVENGKGVKESINVMAVARSLTADENGGDAHHGHGEHSGH